MRAVATYLVGMGVQCQKEGADAAREGRTYWKMLLFHIQACVETLKTYLKSFSGSNIVPSAKFGALFQGIERNFSHRECIVEGNCLDEVEGKGHATPSRRF